MNTTADAHARACAAAPWRSPRRAGCSVFASVELREYPVFLGALAATVTELYEPLLVNDNLTIPVCASLAMQWGFNRIRRCTNVSSLQWLRDVVWSLLRDSEL